MEDLEDIHTPSLLPRHEVKRDKRRFTFSLEVDEDACHNPEKVYIKVTAPIPKITLDAIDDGKYMS